MQAINLRKFEGVRVSGEKIICHSANGTIVLARYGSEERAKEIFENMLEDLAKANELPFTESISPYWMPEE